MARLPAPEVIVIADASAGVGRATARAFARPGVRIGLIARGRADLESGAPAVRTSAAHTRSPQLWLTTHRRALAAAGTVAAAAAGAWNKRRVSS